MVDNNLHEALMTLQECGMVVNDMKKENIKQIDLADYEKLLSFFIDTVERMQDFLSYVDNEFEKITQ